MISKFNITINSKRKKSAKNSACLVFLNKSEKSLSSDITKYKNLQFSDYQLEKINNEKLSEFEFTFQNAEFDVVLIKKYDLKNITADYFRDELSKVAQSLKNKNLDYLEVNIPDSDELIKKYDSASYFAQTFVEGLYLGNYEFDKFKSEKTKAANTHVNFVYNKKINSKNLLSQSKVLMESVYFVRDLVNDPAIELTPAELAKKVKKEFAKEPVTVKVFNEKELERRKMNALLSVGTGSSQRPLMIQMHYKGKNAKKKIALVGKGVTYDSGGYSIKPTSGMLDMKADMAGAGAVIGMIKAAAMLNLPVELIGIVPAVENMVSGSSYKPGDVIRTASGKSIEVKDTDAEGRIILADALEYASKLKPDEILDFATLTGACVVALGEFASGVFTKNNEIANKLLASGEKTFELTWRLPFGDIYKKLLDSKIADISNLGPRWGGAITAGKFLENFVDENIPYAHIDIAGPSIHNDLNSYSKDGATGYGVRLIVDYLQN